MNAPYFFRAVAGAFALMLVLSSCTREETRFGCLDPLAENFDPTAQQDNGECVYPAFEQLVWNDGVAGAWEGDTFIYGVIIRDCHGTIDTVQAAGRTSIALMKAPDEQFGMTAHLANRREVEKFTNGFLKFEAMMAEGSTAIEIDVFMHGTWCPQTNCGTICRSEFIKVSTVPLNTTAFQEIAIALPDFDDASFRDMDVLFGLTSTAVGGNDTVMFINNIRWTSTL